MQISATPSVASEGRHLASELLQIVATHTRAGEDALAERTP